jgi:hypothetical protein
MKCDNEACSKEATMGYLKDPFGKCNDWGQRCADHAPKMWASDALAAKDARIAELEAALQNLLPGLEIDLRYADADDDTDAMRSRVKTVRDALWPPQSETPAKYGTCPECSGQGGAHFTSCSHSPTKTLGEPK